MAGAAATAAMGRGTTGVIRRAAETSTDLARRVACRGDRSVGVGAVDAMVSAYRRGSVT